MLDTVRWSPRDMALIRSLGLRQVGGSCEWTDLGTVTVCEGATVQAEVACFPAKFWRFTVTRPNEDKPGEVERRVLTTGSGSLTDYWHIARLVAENMLDIEGVE